MVLKHTKIKHELSIIANWNKYVPKPKMDCHKAINSPATPLPHTSDSSPVTVNNASAYLRL